MILGSAKGGVTLPNKNNISVAFGGAAAVVCENYGATSQDNVQEMDGTKRNYSLKMLDGFPMIGCKIATAATLYNSSGAVRDASDAVNMTELSTSLAWIPFPFSSPSTVDEDDFISFTPV